MSQQSLKSLQFSGAASNAMSASSCRSVRRAVPKDFGVGRVLGAVTGREQICFGRTQAFGQGHGQAIGSLAFTAPRTLQQVLGMHPHRCGC